MTDHPPDTRHPLHGLLTPGSRLGWRYQDPAAAMTPFGEAPPPPPPLPQQPPTDTSSSQLIKRLLLAAGLGLGATAMLACCGFLASGPSGATDLGAQITLTAALLGLGTLTLLGAITWQHQTRTRQAAEQINRPQRQYQAALALWRERTGHHHATEAARVALLPVWQATGPPPEAKRLDIIGGTQLGWRDLLTVAGAGYLAAHGPSTIVDLTGDHVCADLIDLCTGAQISTDRQTPPDDSDLLADLDTGQLIDVLVESVHGEGDRELRAQRATDTRILSALAESLNGQVTLERISDALRVLLRIPGPTPALTTAERRHIADDLFPPDYLTTAATALQRLEAHIHPLRALTTVERPAAMLTVMGALTHGTSARSELLDDLIIGWITRRVATRPDLCRTLVVAGADHLPPRHVERLADICSRQSVTLILLWRHLRDTAHQALGGGTVAFMRLRNAEEAGRAADFIGRQHRFVLSGFTRTVGGSTTATEGTGTSHSVATSTSRGIAHAGRIGQLIDHAQAFTRSRGHTSGTTWTTSTQESTATNKSWSDTTSEQRVYEYTVEPTTLQALPEQAVILVEHGPHGLLVQALDCNPAIVTLPAVNMAPQTPTHPTPPHTPALTHTPPPSPFTTRPALQPGRHDRPEQ